ncbi:MAG TPA: hypothetical protein VGW39_10525, partial [Chthoniobacterales bacterium]|nr:hypothetical protein [Chthoniobacterales bacterium]
VADEIKSRMINSWGFIWPEGSLDAEAAGYGFALPSGNQKSREIGHHTGRLSGDDTVILGRQRARFGSQRDRHSAAIVQPGEIRVQYHRVPEPLHRLSGV